MERTLKLTIAYDGTGFHGWQRQAGVRTVQAEIEEVARRVFRHPLEIVGASRTDAGVHARGQVAHVRTDRTIPIRNLYRAIGQRLPGDISLVHVSEVPPCFHATRSALAKLYRYRIHNHAQRPVEAHAGRLTWHVWHELDLGRMRSAAEILVGTHDFLAFAGAGCVRRTTVRTVQRIEIRRHLDSVLIDVEGGGFLYNQVRNFVGTLVEVGRGHWSSARVAEILASRDRRQAGPTAPACGLCLEWIRYPANRSLVDEA